MEDAVHAIIMAFSVFIFVVGLTIAIYMFSQITTTSETLLYFSDKTNYYDNIVLDEENGNKTDRIVDVETIIPTLYRYYKENFCVKICDADGKLLQIFDLNIEGKVRRAAGVSSVSKRTYEQQALYKKYNTKGNDEYLFEAPWLGSAETGKTNQNSDIKKRIDYYVNGTSGYINNTYVNYTKNPFYKIRKNNSTDGKDKIHFTEKFISYSYTGDTFTTDDGDILINGNESKDKIVIIYTADKKKSEIDG